MKRFIFYTLFLLMSMPVMAQNKGDNIIIAHGSVCYSKIVEALFNEGFATLNHDTTYITAIGSAMTMGPFPEISCVIKRTDSVLIFRGYLGKDLQGYYTSGSPVKYEKAIYKKAFARMNRVATALGLPLSYNKEL